MIDTSMLEFVTCPICPGNMKIFPASALGKHNETAHQIAGIVRLCCDCKQPYEVVMQSKRCAKCRHSNKSHRPSGIRNRQMSSTGIEKDAAIAQRYGVKR